MDFGDRIAQIRRENGMLKEYLGNKVGTSAAIIGRYKCNDMKPSIEIVKKIAQARNVSFDYVVSNSSLIAKDENIMERLDENIANMPSLQKQNLLM